MLASLLPARDSADERGSAAVDSHGDSLRPASNAELCVDVVEVFPHRSGGDEENGGDLAVRHARSDEAEDFALARAEKRGGGGGLDSAGEAEVPLPDEREVRGEDVEHGAITIAERPPLVVQAQVAGAGLADGEEQLHHVVDAEWSADLCVEIEPVELAEAEDVGDATRHSQGSDQPRCALWPRGKGILIDHVVVHRPHMPKVRPVRAVHHAPVADVRIPLSGGRDCARDEPSQRRQHVPRERDSIVGLGLVRDP